MPRSTLLIDIGGAGGLTGCNQGNDNNNNNDNVSRSDDV